MLRAKYLLVVIETLLEAFSARLSGEYNIGCVHETLVTRCWSVHSMDMPTTTFARPAFSQYTSKGWALRISKAASSFSPSQMPLSCLSTMPALSIGSKKLLSI